MGAGRRVLIWAIISLALAGQAFAADNVAVQNDKQGAPPLKTGAEAAVKVRDMTAQKLTPQEMAAEVVSALDDESEIMDFIPGLKRETDPSGKAFYTFQGVKIGDLDKDAIGKLYTRVHQERTRINTERISDQLESVRRIQQIQQLNNMAGSAAAARNVQAIPQVPPSANVPQVPKLPPRPPAVPKR